MSLIIKTNPALAEINFDLEVAMGNPTGFIEYARELPEDRTPEQRILDWNEFHLHLSEEDQKKQGARCMECSVPFCHSGILLNGMASGCPLNNLIPEWNDLIYRGLWREALTRLQSTNNFPEFTGRVCPAPCEGACTVGISTPQVTIKSNECAIIDRAFDNNWITPEIPITRTGKKVAVVGSGPSGLACAAQLNSEGHTVVVYERSDRIGGLLMYGIPNMKLDKSIVNRRVDILRKEGITFKTETEVGTDFPAEQLLNDFDSVVLCCGSTKPRDLQVEGRQLKGVHYAMEFLHSNTKSLLDSNHTDSNYISAKGLDVIVIGGGDTGTDCVATSLRHKCNSIVQFEIMPQAPNTRTSENPWPQWPKTLKTDYGQEEAIAIFGEDPREYCIMTKRIIGDNDGRVKEVHTVKVYWEKDASGHFLPREIPGSEHIWPAQLVLISMGFLGPENTLLKQLGVEQDNRTNVKTEKSRFKTNVNKVFCAGDMHRGQSLVVWAINEGRNAAKECGEFLMRD